MGGAIPRGHAPPAVSQGGSFPGRALGMKQNMAAGRSLRRPCWTLWFFPSESATISASVSPLEQNPKKLIDFFDKILLQLFDSGAISYRPDDSVWSESALRGDPRFLCGLCSPA